MNRIIIVALVATCMAVGSVTAKKPKSTAETPKAALTAYEKLFKDKKSVRTQTGLMTVHQVDGRLLMEFPVSMSGERFAINATVAGSSSMEVAWSGRPVSSQLTVTALKVDTMIQFRLQSQRAFSDSPEISQALTLTDIGGTFASLPIKAMTPDSTSAVIDVTDLLSGSDRRIANLNSSGMGGMSQISAAYKKDRSFLDSFAVYPDNIVVRNCATYGCKVSVMGMSNDIEQPLTVMLNIGFTHMKPSTMTPRRADARVGSAYEQVARFDANRQGSEQVYNALRWDLTGGRNVVFYIDSLFSKPVGEALTQGILRWNEAFEQAGLGRPIVVKPYPANDPEFSPDNIRYNCVRLIQSSARDISCSVLTGDNGEIRSASIYVSPEAIETIQRSACLKLGAIDPRMRTLQMDEAPLKALVSATVTPVAGLCLGLSSNFAGATSIPVDSLRSTTFTQTHGLTYSVMNGIACNMAAQPGDLEKGVATVQDRLGDYDRMAIRWLYGKIDAAELSKLCTEPQYYYAKPQARIVAFDPRTSSDNQGDNPMKLADLTLKNLKYVASHAYDWIDRPETNESTRQLFLDFVWLDTYARFVSVVNWIGGAYVRENYVGDTLPSFVPIPAVEQRRALNYFLEKIEDLSWLNADPRLLQASGLVNDAASFLQVNLCTMLRNRLASVPVVCGEEYPYADILDDLLNYLSRKIVSGKALPRSADLLLEVVSGDLSKRVKIVGPGGVIKKSAGSDIAATVPTRIPPYLSAPDTEATVYAALIRLKGILDRGVSVCSDTVQRERYAYISFKIDRVLRGK